jgi:hypothetical protein
MLAFLNGRIIYQIRKAEKICADNIQSVSSYLYCASMDEIVISVKKECSLYVWLIIAEANQPLHSFIGLSRVA